MDEAIEVSARTVDEAIAKALAQLGRTRDEVQISVLSEGNRGILGFGSEDARILVSLKPEVETEEQSQAEPAEITETEDEEEPETVAAPVAEASLIEMHDEDLEEEIGEQTGEDIDIEDLADVARDVLEEILSVLSVEATVQVRDLEAAAQQAQNGDRRNAKQVSLNIRGEDLGMLIGRRGETLAALQLITNIIVGKRLHKWVRVAVDVENYRVRREEALRGLALRMAERAKLSRTAVPLEPMPANERRIIHMALADNPTVSTESFGEGEERHIVIAPRQNNQRGR